MKQRVHLSGSQIPQSGRIAGNPAFDASFTLAWCAVFPDTLTPFTNSKAEAVGRTQIVMMAGPTGNIAVAG